MNDIPKWLIIFISIILFITLGWYFSNIVAYVLIAGVLSLLGQPLVDFLSEDIRIKKWHIPRSLASLITMGLMFLFSMLFGSIFIPLILSQSDAIAAIDIQQVSRSLDKPIATLESYMMQYGIGGMDGVSLKQNLQVQLKELVTFTSVTNFFNRSFAIMGNILLASLSITFILFFFLRDKHLFYRMLLVLVPSENEKDMSDALKSIKQLLIRYFIGIAIQIAIVVTIIAIGLSLVGLKNAILIGFFAGIFNIIPYIGPIIGAVIGLVLGLTTALPMELYPDMLYLILKITSVFAVAQLLDNFILQPLIFSNSVKAHPLEIFLVILAGGSMAGIGGMILAIPTYTVLRVVGKEFFGEFKLVKKLTQNI